MYEALEQTIRNCPTCSTRPGVKLDASLCDECRVRNKCIHRYAESNIPVIYWNLEMDLHFRGDQVLLEKYKEITNDIKKTYSEGSSFCFAGNHGLGKTFVCCNVLKRAAEKGYSCLYVNLGDIVNIMLSRDSEDKGLARKELLLVDFLVIDEFDPRYMSNDKSSDLFGKILEEIFRTRHQNGLPTMMCTNSPNVIESFSGSIKESITSLLSTVKTITLMPGKDHRKLGVKK